MSIRYGPSAGQPSAVVRSGAPCEPTEHVRRPLVEVGAELVRHVDAVQKWQDECRADGLTDAPIGGEERRVGARMGGRQAAVLAGVVANAARERAEDEPGEQRGGEQRGLHDD